MQALFKYWEEQFYTVILRDITLLITLLVAFKNRKKFKILRFIPFYTFFFLLVSFSVASAAIGKSLNFHPNFLSGLEDYIDYSFTLVEMIIFSHFYYQMSNRKALKKIIFITSVIFSLFFVYMATRDEAFSTGISRSTQSIVYTVEGIILLMICCYYFIDLFRKMPFVDLKNEPVFWISSGLLFFMACTLPYSLLENYIASSYPATWLTSYSIFHVFYILLFLMIIRAYLCKPQKEI